MTKHVAIYERVSSKSQDTAAQRPDLERWVKANGAEPAWYRDKFTGKTMDRKGWGKLWAAAERGEIQTIVIWRLDRLGRTAKGLTALFDELIARKINLVSLREGFDLSTPAGRLMAHVLASVAQYETEVRSERQRAGIDAARAAGKQWGGSERGRLLTVTPEQVATVKRLHREGAAIAAIARSVGLSRPTVYRLLAA